jgi:hypothetical protein
VIKRTLAWLTAHRRLVRDYERQPGVSEALIRWAAINGMLRRITRGMLLVAKFAVPSHQPESYLKRALSCR